MEFDRDFLTGTVRLLILSLLRERAMYGYELLQEAGLPRLRGENMVSKKSNWILFTAMALRASTRTFTSDAGRRGCPGI